MKSCGREGAETSPMSLGRKQRSGKDEMKSTDEFKVKMDELKNGLCFFNSNNNRVSSETVKMDP